MKCPVCDNVNESMVCVRCGFDSSRDYEKYPTFGPVGRVPAVSARVFRTGALKNKSSTKPWRRNILRSDKVPNDFKSTYTEYTVFGSDYQRKQISSVTFLDTLAYMPDDAWDVSEAGNGTVMTWVKPNGELYDLYIGAEGGVCAGTSCEQLFAGYCCAGHITFGDAFHTENVQNMGDMFMNCYNLKDLDLSGFDTSNVQQMYYMFAYCRNFTVLDLSAFNTSNVNNMAAMFMGCGRLSELNVSRFDTSKVRVMNFMFENCEKLSTLDLSSFDVSCVTQMHSMFANCPAGGNYKDLFLKPKKEVPTEPAQREKPEKHEPAPVRPEPVPVPVKQSPKVPVWLMAVVCMLTMVLGIWVGTGVRKPEPTEPGESAQMQEPQEDEVRAQARTILADMTLEEKIWQMFVVDIDQLAGRYSVTKSGTKVKDAIKSKPVGGVICFPDNLIDRVQTDAMIRNIQGYAEIPLFISVDEEGGIVTRLGGRSDFGVTDFGKMYDVGEAGDITKAYEVGAILGAQLRELGFNLNFAPVADIWTNPDNLVIGKRAFGSEPNEVANMVSFCVRGFMNQNVLCTLKHFPGYGDTVGDSSVGSVSCQKTLEELWDCELVPFRSGIDAGAPVVMIGHINLPNVAGAEDVPASLSGTIISDLLRDQMGFEGLIITDAMSMGAITAHYRSDEAARLAIQAGVDLILMPDDMDAAFKGILDAVASGEISEERIDESVLRILETKLRYGIIPESNG